MIIGVDPGIHGAVALVTDGGDLLRVWDMPVVEVRGKKRVSAPLLAGIVREAQARLAVLEDVGAMPGQGVTSMFSFGRSAGLGEGICAALGVAVVMVRPADWKKSLKVTADKGSCRQMAQRLWPAMAGEFARVKDDGRAESALIAFFGRAQWQRDAA